MTEPDPADAADAGSTPAPSEDAADWFAAEPPLWRQVVEDLRRFKHRARSRVATIVIAAAVLTGGVVYRIARKPPVYIARVILALSEGSVSQRNAPMPVRDLRAYVTTVLLPAAELTKLIERRDLFPLRKKLGPEFALAELWDVMEIEVYRNYFLYEQSEIAERSARISVAITWNDPDAAYELARDVADVIVHSAAGERDRAARVMADDAARATESARERVAGLEADLAGLEAARTAAQDARQQGKLAGLAVEIAQVESSLKRAREAASALAKASSADQLLAAVYAAGLGLDVSLVEERRPEPEPPRGYRIAMVSAVVLVAMLVLVTMVLGAFDTRIHDVDDITRLGIPVVGQVPGFPGDQVGSLRERGVVRRGVPWSRR